MRDEQKKYKHTNIYNAERDEIRNCLFTCNASHRALMPISVILLPLKPIVEMC